MSLINDALKRAKQAHQETAPPPAPVAELRPVEPPPPTARHGSSLLVPLALFVAALVGLLLCWDLWRKQNLASANPAGAQFEAAARTPNADLPPVSANTSNPYEAALSSSMDSASPPPADTNSQTGGQGAETNQATATELPTPAPLKLQGIVFNPKRPSAIISGRMMFVGDRIRDLRVMAIHPGEVVLVGSSQTNLLSLEP
jgi:hypothetical protein